MVQVYKASGGGSTHGSGGGSLRQGSLWGAGAGGTGHGGGSRHGGAGGPGGGSRHGPGGGSRHGPPLARAGSNLFAVVEAPIPASLVEPLVAEDRGGSDKARSPV